MNKFRLNRRTALGLGAGGLISLAQAPFAARANRPDLSGVTLRVGTFRGQDQTFLPAAGQAETPYKVEYHEFNSGQVIAEAMNAGALDFGGWSEIPLAFAAAAGARIRTIAVLQGDVNNQVVLVQKYSDIKSISDLKDKRVGYVRATTSHYYLLRMLWAAGLDFNDIQAINLSPTDGATAFRAGDLDAWAIYGYAIQFALSEGNARILRTAKGILSGNYFLGAAPAALADPGLRAAIADYLVRTGRSYVWVEGHKQQWAEILAPVIKVPLPFVAQALDNESQPYRVNPVNDAAIASAQQVADTFSKAGLIPGHVDVAPYFDKSLAPAIATI
jgi:sulfonate transport system substrate-binding protein